MGTHGRRGLSHAFAGSVTEAVAARDCSSLGRTTPCVQRRCAEQQGAPTIDARMNLTNEQAAGFFVPVAVSLESVLGRLDALSRQPEFVLQRELGLARALQPYLEDGAGGVLPALPQETELANLSLFCDFYPEDGQLTLIEQLRDVITEHIPDEERAWLDH